MWSAMLLAAALPGRSMIDSGSPSEVAHSIGWNPNPALKCAAAPALFSECTSTSVESMSKTTAADPRVAAAAPTQRRAQTPQQQKRLHRLGAQAPQRAIQRRSDATCPNSTGWARRCSMSLHASPPPASINNA